MKVAAPGGSRRQEALHVQLPEVTRCPHNQGRERSTESSAHRLLLKPGVGVGGEFALAETLRQPHGERTIAPPVPGKNGREESLGVDGKDTPVSVDRAQGQVSSCQRPGTLRPLSANPPLLPTFWTSQPESLSICANQTFTPSQFHSPLPSVIPSYLLKN